MNVSRNCSITDPIRRFITTEIPFLHDTRTVAEAFALIRRQNIAEKIVYFYVIDDEGRLVGVVPLRRLIVAEPTSLLQVVMIRDVVTISDSATVLDACRMFNDYKFLAFPVVDADYHLLGMIDVSIFTGEMVDFRNRQAVGEVFETIGFQVERVSNATPFTAFRYRFPWLVPTFLSGLICALLAGAYERTLAQSLIIAFFLTLILGLGESVCIQSLTITIRALQKERLRWSWYGSALWREMVTALLLGGSSGLFVTLLVFFWKGAMTASLVIGASITLSLATSCFMGLSVPVLIHACRLDPKVAAGPLALALADMCTLLFYFSLANAFL